jgi:hypothetical protein
MVSPPCTAWSNTGSKSTVIREQCRLANAPGQRNGVLTFLPLELNRASQSAQDGRSALGDATDGERAREVVFQGGQVDQRLDVSPGWPVGKRIP